MDEFPFSNTDWDRIQDATHSIFQATLADDAALTDSLFLDLRETLHDLRFTYGNHPVLLETEADFCGDADDAIPLYAEALRIADENGIATDSICLSYARRLIENSRDIDQARELLDTCRDVILASADSSAINEYNELKALLKSRRR